MLSNDKDEVVQINYRNAIDKMLKVTKNWQNRTLSIIGKIEVINVLIIPLFIHLLAIIYTPGDAIWLRIHQIINQFLWNNSVPKFKFHCLTNNYYQGGLKLCDIKVKEVAMKCKWLYTVMQKNSLWSHYAFEILPMPVSLIIQTNVTKKDLSTYLNNESIWFDVWKAWSFYSYQEEISNYKEILNQLLWFNSSIKIENKVVFFKDWYIAGIHYIYDIVDIMTGRFHSFDVIVTNFNLNPNKRLQYYQLISAIPKTWKDCIKTNSCQAEFEFVDIKGQVLVKTQLCKILYWEMIYNKKIPDTSKVKWEIDLNSTIDDSTWENIRYMPYVLTISVKLRYFQYRLLSHKLTTNKDRHRWDKDINPLCTFCKKELETVIHLFCDCEYIKPILNQVVRWFNYVLETNFVITKTGVILNNYTGQHSTIFNLCLLIVKQRIYAAKCLGKNITSYQLIQKIYEIYNIEKIIAYKTNVTVKHHMKWLRFIENAL